MDVTFFFHGLNKSKGSRLNIHIQTRDCVFENTANILTYSCANIIHVFLNL